MARIEDNKKIKLKRIISESVRKTLNEMGTYKQNAFCSVLWAIDINRSMTNYL